MPAQDTRAVVDAQTVVKNSIKTYFDSIEAAVTAMREALDEDNYILVHDLSALSESHLRNVEWWASKAACDMVRFSA